MAIQKNNQYYIDSCNISVPVSIEKYLLPFLSPTAPGTNYWDSPREAKLQGLGEREISRIVDQVNEIISLIRKRKESLLADGKTPSFLDVGTGNGMVPRLLCSQEEEIIATGIDPFLHGGHKTSWQSSKINEELDNCRKYFCELKGIDTLNSNSNHEIRYKEYKRYLDEHLREANEKYDFVYCKAIEHVPNWRDMADQLCSSVGRNGLLIIKHRSFFSYLGPHRYSSTAIPWGHCLLREREYKKYAETFHKGRSREMSDFYFNGLSNPRMTIEELLRQCNKGKLNLVSLTIKKPRYSDLQAKVIEEMPWLIDLILRNNNGLSYEELTSGLITLVLEKNG